MNRPDPIYLDHAAATPLSEVAREAMRPHLESSYANPSSLYEAARQERRAVEAARAKIAGIMGAKPTEIVFTSGGTEGNNAAIQGLLHHYPGSSWVTTAIEHDAVLALVEPMRSMDHAAAVIPVLPTGIVDPAAVMSAVTDTTVLISVMLANNEIGTLQPVADIARLVKATRADRHHRNIQLPLYVHTDAVQATNFIDLHVDRLGIDLLTINGSKMYGPKGVGALYVRTGTNLSPLIYGGGQERGRRSGTENVAGIAGLAAAYDEAVGLRSAEGHRLAALRDELARRLSAAIPGMIINGHPTRRLPNNLNLTIPGAEGEALVLYLDNAGIMASTGSACSTGDLDPSHVLLAIGRSADEANSSLRFTLGRATTPEHIDYLVATLPQIIERVRMVSS